MNVVAEQKHWQEGMKTHENIIYACFGCLSNTGITAGLGSLEAVKELGLDKVAVGCLASLPLGIAPVIRKTKAAKKIITVDGCPFECSRKIVEAAGFKPYRSFMLVRDIGMTKKALHEDIGGELKPVMDYVSPKDIERTKQLIVEAISEG
ncbi:MAG: putative zinc-binding protein [Candidatus Bathyarchaeia archaeon]